MALVVNIEELINGQVIEWERLEFKKGWNPEEIIHTLCAFANDFNNLGGGYIIIGVEEENGRAVLPPTGLDPNKIDFLQGELTKLCFKIQPTYLPMIQPVFFMGKHILVVQVSAGDIRPYSSPNGLGKEGLTQKSYFIRSGSRTIKATGENLRKLMELTARVPFDDRINHSGTIDDLDLGLIRDFLHEIKSDLAAEATKMPFDDLCRRMNIIKGPAEFLRPVNVGLLFFNKNPELFFNRAWIEVVLRKDEDGKDFTEKYFKGPLHIQLRAALNFIKTNVVHERVRKVSWKAEANRSFNYPFSAIEEALANAVYHKSYDLHKPIEVQIFPDRIEILSFPGPVPPVALQFLTDNRRLVARDYRNRRVGDFLKELHLTEGRGTGIPSIYKSMEKNNSPKPVFHTDVDSNFFLTILHANLGNYDQDRAAKYDQDKSPNQNEINEMEFFDIFDSDKLNDQDKVVLAFCKSPKSRAQILSMLGLANHFDNYRRYIAPLLELEILQRTIPDKPNSKNQKYVTIMSGDKLKKRKGNDY